MFRALRVLRVLRLLTLVPSMRRVVSALLGAIPGLFSIALLLAIIYYVFAVIATNLFAAAYPEWFGHLGRSLYTLFQIMTLESWSMGIARPVMEGFPYAWAFFVPFILVATFTMLNLFIAIIVNAMQSYRETEHRETVAAVAQVSARLEADLHGEVQALREDIRCSPTTTSPPSCGRVAKAGPSSRTSSSSCASSFPQTSAPCSPSSVPPSGLPAPFTAIQVLWINIIMDGPPAMTLGLNPPRVGVMDAAPRLPGQAILSGARIGRLVQYGLTIAAGTLGVFWWALHEGGEGHALTLAFTTFVLFQFFNVMNTRNQTGSAFNRQLFANGKLWLALAAVLVLQIVVVHWGPAQAIFATVDLSVKDWGFALAIASSVLWVEEVRKLALLGLPKRG